MRQVQVWVTIVWITLTSSLCMGYSGGLGTPENPYQIANTRDLWSLPPADYNKCFILTADIDFAGSTVILAFNSEFTGVFNGNGHKIKRFSITGGNNAGLFGTIGKTGKVENLGLENFTIKGSGSPDYAGGLAAYNKGLIRNCYTVGTVQGYNYVGGLVGFNDFGMIINCYATGTISGSNYNTGGLTGNNYYGYIGNCFSTSTVSGRFYTGGLVGRNFSGRIANSYSTGAVSGTSSIGGLAGVNESDSDISHCYSTGLVQGTTSVGGLIGYNYGIVNQSYWDIAASGRTTSAGGEGKTTAEMQQLVTFTTSSLATGKIGNALKLDGLDDYVEVPNYYGIGGANPRTVSLWVKIPTGGNFSTKTLVQWGTNVKGQLWSLYIGDGVMPAVSVFGGGVYSRKSVADSQWHQITAVLETVGIDSKQIKLYIDGVLDSTMTPSFAINTAQTTPVRLGATNARESGAEFLMDEVCIYDHALTADEIAPVYAAGLAAHWKLDETQGSTTAYDSAGSHNGALYNMSAGSWVAGKTGGALQFDGVDDYVEIPDYFGIGGTNARTVSLWVKTSSSSKSPTLVQWGSDTTGQIWMLLVQTDGTVRLGAYDGAVYSTRSVVDGQWHHIAAVLDEGQTRSDQIRLYIDGQLDAVATTNVCMINTAQSVPVHLGVWYKYSSGVRSNYFAGLMDDVCIYNQALKPEDFFPQLPPVPTKGLVARWSMETIENNMIYDSVSAYHGILKNTTGESKWDFVNETANGTCNYWAMPNGGGYPILSTLSGYTPPRPAGSGTQADPYLITNADLLGTLWYQPSAYYLLTNDIDLTGIRWGMSVVPEFNGVLDGDGFRIKNLSVYGAYYLGLIGRINSGGQVRNLGIENGTISGKDNAKYVGGLTGYNYYGSLDQCYSTGSVSGTAASCFIGGLAGYNNNGTIGQCYSTCSVGTASITYGGGLVGLNRLGGIIDCYSTGSVSGSAYLGGLVSGAGSDPKIVNCFWDTQTSKQQGSGGGTGKTTADMKKLATFAGFSWTAGRTGNALKFDGVDDYVEIPDYFGIGGTNARTVSLWVKTSSSSKSPTLVQWGSDTAGQIWMLMVQTDGTVRLGAYDGAVYSTRSVVDGQWHHIAAVLDEGQTRSDQIRLYIDGQLDAVATTNVCTINTAQSVPVHLGVWYKYSSGVRINYFAGLMDDVRIYNKALDASEIVPESLPATGLAAHWTMDETAGAFVHDSVSSYDGRLRNSVVWDFVTSIADQADHTWFIREGLEYPRFVWEDWQPIAQAGQDVSIHCQPNGFAIVQLNGSASSDADKDPLHYFWSWTIAQQNFTAEGAAPTIQLPPGTHVITLIVTDGFIDSEPKTVTVTVYNTAPTADAGPDSTSCLGFESNTVDMVLDGSNSSDPDGDALTYKWFLGETLLSEEVKPTVSLPAGQHSITLIVNDGLTDSPADGVVVTVIGPVGVRIMILPEVLNLKRHDRYVWIIMDLPRGIGLTQLDKDYGYFVLPGQIRPERVGYIGSRNPAVAAMVELEQLRQYLHTGRMKLTVYGRLIDGRYIGGSEWVSVINPSGK